MAQAATAIQEPSQALSANFDAVRVVPSDGGPEAMKAFIAEAATCLQDRGIVVLKNAIPREAVAAALAHCKTVHESYMRPGQSALIRNFQDDAKRAQIPISPVGGFGNPLIFANPVVMALVRRFVGDEAIIGEMGAVISHPGSKPQYSHRDSTFLFGGLPSELDLPPHSLSVTIPLLDVPLELGPTEYWMGSHRKPDQKAVTATPPQRTPLEAGSLLLYDGRLMHRGGANRSDVVRPIVYFTYQRPWYIERSGYDGKPQVKVTPAMLWQMAPEHRRLFEWALHLNRADTVNEFLMRWADRIKRKVVEPMSKRRS